MNLREKLGTPFFRLCDHGEEHGSLTWTDATSPVPCLHSPSPIPVPSRPSLPSYVPSQTLTAAVIARVCLRRASASRLLHQPPSHVRPHPLCHMHHCTIFVYSPRRRSPSHTPSSLMSPLLSWWPWLLLSARPRASTPPPPLAGMDDATSNPPVDAAPTSN